VLHFREALAGLVCLSAAALCAPAVGSEAGKQRSTLTICADPGNLPYSNKALEGFENKVAAILADDLDVDLAFFWFAEHKGFIGRTLLVGNCDAIVSVPLELTLVATTQPYFTSSYVAVQRSNDQRRFSSFDDPWLHEARIGLQLVGNEGATTPPAVALSRRGVNRHIEPFPMWSEDETGSPQGEIVDAVADGRIDVAFLWGPFAGYFAKKHGGALRIEPILRDPASPDLSFVFAMSIGVRKSDGVLRNRLQKALDRHASEIAKVLEDHGVPLVERPADIQPSAYVSRQEKR
jgi:mxaJ protein